MTAEEVNPNINSVVLLSEDLFVTKIDLHAVKNMRVNYMTEKRKGFTLVEVIVVLVILAILAALFIPTLVGYIDKAKSMSIIITARQIYLSANSGLVEWRAKGSPGNSDNAFKINIETETIIYLDSENMNSYTKTKGNENVVQVALSLPSSFSQGWAQFIKDCKANNYRNFARVWIGKKPDKSIGDSIKGIYYISADGKYAVRIVYDATTKLGSVNERTGTYFERID